MKGNGRGRPHKPTKQKVLEGKLPVSAGLADNLLENVLFECPDHLFPESRQEFDRLLPHLRRAGYEKQIYFAPYVAMCQAWGFAQAAAKSITPETMLEVDEQGVTRKHPAFQIVKDQMAIYNTFASKFGLSPSDRARLGAEAEPIKKGGILSIIARANAPKTA